MDLELKSFGLTLAVGGLAIYGCLWSIQLLFGKNNFIGLPPLFTEKPKHPDNHKVPVNILETAVWIAFLLGTGILVEDVSKAITAERCPSALKNIIQHCPYTDRTLRFNSLFNKVENKKEGIVLTVGPADLYNDLRLRSCYEPVFQHHFSELVTSLGDDRTIDQIKTYAEKKIVVRKTSAPLSVTDQSICDPEQRIINSANVMFYRAKNRVYSSPTYFNELNEISHRMDFSRSGVLLGICLSFLYVIALIVNLARKRKREIRVALAALLIPLVLLLLSLLSYQSEARNLNMRVFGYYLSMSSHDCPK